MAGIITAPIIGSGIMDGFGVMEEAYVWDEVLVAFENRTECDIHPESGAIIAGLMDCIYVGRPEKAVGAVHNKTEFWPTSP